MVRICKICGNKLNGKMCFYCEMQKSIGYMIMPKLIKHFNKNNVLTRQNFKTLQNRLAIKLGVK